MDPPEYGLLFCGCLPQLRELHPRMHEGLSREDMPARRLTLSGIFFLALENLRIGATTRQMQGTTNFTFARLNKYTKEVQDVILTTYYPGTVLSFRLISFAVATEHYRLRFFWRGLEVKLLLAMAKCMLPDLHVCSPRCSPNVCRAGGGGGAVSSSVHVRVAPLPSLHRR